MGKFEGRQLVQAILTKVVFACKRLWWGRRLGLHDDLRLAVLLVLVSLHRCGLAIRRRDDKVVGVIDLRHHINHPILGTWGGHCGYSVRPSERGKGYAKEMLRLNMQNAKSMGIEKLLITCDLKNAASEKTILANGGVYENTINVDGRDLKRYWITV